MSYILDALKRADAERERGHVPGLHTRTTPELDTPAAGAGSIAQRGWLIALGLLIAGGAMLWWWLGAVPPAEPVMPAQVPAVQTPAAPVEPLQSLAPTQPAEPSDNAASETAPPVLPILAPPLPRAPAKAAASTKPATAAQQPLGEPAATTAPQAATNAPAIEIAVPTFAELSPEARARLPAVNVSGSTYSKNPALRMLIVNGKVVQEGGDIAAGLTLESIAPRSAVLNHQGLRYRIGY